jgi:hypothetical protein
MTTQPPRPAAPIRVKVLSPIPQRYFLHQLPEGNLVWGNCRFSFDPEDRDYDWLVVYEDLRTANKDGKRGFEETLPCPAAHTLLTTSEPSSIKHYGNAYTRQFGCVLTSQEAWALPHPDRIFSQAGLIWIYGVGANHATSFDQMVAHPPMDKTRDLSMVFSPKTMRHTLHKQRNDFMRRLMNIMPEMDVFGRGARPLDDKAEALDPYRYHVAIENYIGPHHWTEKLSDAFLGLTLPFYCGCTNAADYFPAESFIAIDMKDPDGAARIIRQAILDKEYEKRLPAIIEARRRVLFEHNLFAVLSREIEKRHRSVAQPGEHVVIYSRHALRKQSMTHGLLDMYGKARAFAINLIRRG